MTKSDYLATLLTIIDDAKKAAVTDHQTAAIDDFYALERDGFDLIDSDTRNAFYIDDINSRFTSFQRNYMYVNQCSFPLIVLAEWFKKA